VVTYGPSGMSFLLVSPCRLAVSGCWLVSGLCTLLQSPWSMMDLFWETPAAAVSKLALKECAEYLSRFSTEPTLLR
jgi:hypothetical protein